LLHLYNAFWVLKAHLEGVNLLNHHHQCAASTLMIRRQPHRTERPHTPAFWWRGDRVLNMHYAEFIVNYA